MYLKPLRRHLEEMEECDFIELEQRITALFHVICLVWANSKHYRQPARLIVLLQEISNLILDLVSALEILAYILHRVCYGIYCRRCRSKGIYDTRQNRVLHLPILTSIVNEYACTSLPHASVQTVCACHMQVQVRHAWLVL